MSPLRLLAAVERARRVATPQVSWRALAPVVILLVGGIVLLTIASLTRKRASTSWYAPFTVVVAGAAVLSIVPLWARVQAWDKLLWIDLPHHPRGPFSTVGRHGRHRRVQPVRDRGRVRLGDPGRAAGRLVPAPRGPRTGPSSSRSSCWPGPAA